jgi:hypothetical protein
VVSHTCSHPSLFEKTDFLPANQDAELKALDKFISKTNPAKFQPVMSGDYIRQSLQAVYSKPNIEIVHDTIEIKAN